MIDLRGKTAVVTGGSRGVGRAVAEMLAAAGCAVGIGYRSRHDEAQETVDALRAHGVDAWAEPGDLAEESAADALFARADREFAGLDFFIGNAAVWPVADVAIQDMETERWKRTLAINLDSIFYTTRAAARRLRDHGRIVLVSSTAGQRGEAFHVEYAASKGAILSMVKGLCVELAPRDITVNAVAPGWILTDMVDDVLTGGGEERIRASIPLGRIATAEDVAGPIVFLCSPLARHITGEVLNVNGGAVLPG